MAFVMDKLNKIEKTNDIKKLNPVEYEQLAQEISAKLKASSCDAAAVLKRVSEILA